MENPNDPNATEFSCCGSLEKRLSENPGGVLLVAFGVGVAAALLVRSLQPREQPRSHVKQLLEDIQERLHELTDPALSRLHEFAEGGSEALKKGVSSAERIQGRLRSLGCRVGRLFQ